MISLDQVLLLEQKVENAVEKIQQLNAENAALRRKCTELTNALSAKTEQFSSFQLDQNRIEEGVLKALERLSAVENAVHSVSFETDNSSIQKDNQIHSQQEVQNSEEQIPNNAVEQNFKQVYLNTFDNAEPIQNENQNNNEKTDNSQPTFDIF
ncbi:cell division protein ZapB [Treponema pectinovorum]|uniref:cell division protein ZapB n=1 Tax=Treponema pectinovorum TaxID=164 RepID=UPI003D8B42CA